MLWPKNTRKLINSTKITKQTIIISILKRIINSILEERRQITIETSDIIIKPTIKYKHAIRLTCFITELQKTWIKLNKPLTVKILNTTAKVVKITGNKLR